MPTPVDRPSATWLHLGLLSATLALSACGSGEGETTPAPVPVAETPAPVPVPAPAPSPAPPPSAAGAAWTARGEVLPGFHPYINAALQVDALAVAWAGSQWVAVGGSENTWHSTDGLAWTRVMAPSNATGLFRGNLWAVSCLASGECVAVGHDIEGAAATPVPMAWRSTNAGQSWVRHPLPAMTGFPQALAHVNGTWWAIGNAAGAAPVLQSTDGSHWTVAATLPGTLLGVSYPNSLVWTGSEFLVTGNGGLLASPDGIAWSVRAASGLSTANTSNAFRGLACSPDLCVGVGRKSTDGGTGTGAPVLLATSTDAGRTWTEHSAAVALNGSLEDVRWTGSRFVAVGSGTPAILLSSSDGVTWFSHGVAGQNYVLRSVAFNGSRLVAVGSLGSVFTSD